MNTWSHLPNAAHIDRILESLKRNPGIWTSVSIGKTDDDWNMWEQVRDVIWGSNRNGIWAEVREVIWNSVIGGSSGAAADAVLSLIAYDNCAHYLNCSSDELEFIAGLSGHPATFLLVPAVRAFELEERSAK